MCGVPTARLCAVEDDNNKDMCVKKKKKKKVAVQSPVPARLKKVSGANIEILQCVARGGPRRSLLFRDKSFVS